MTSRCFTALLGLLLSLPCFALADNRPRCSDTKGREFILGFMENQPSRTAPELVITTRSTQFVNVKVTAPLAKPSWALQLIVTKGSMASAFIPPNLRASGIGKSNKGIHVEADEDVTVTGINPATPKVLNASEKGSVGFYLGLPVNGLGTEYYIVTSDSHPEFLLVATQDHTTITILWPAHINDISEINRRQWIVLHKFQTYHHINNSSNVDYTGVRIKSDKPIAVISGSKENRQPDRLKSYLTEMLTPTNMWGKRFLATGMPGASADLIKVVSCEKDTRVTFSGGRVIHLQDAGQFENVTIQKGDSQDVTSNKPVQVMVFSERFEEAVSSMAVIIPQAQYCNCYTWIAMFDYDNRIVVIILGDKVQGLRLDGGNTVIWNEEKKISGTNLTRLSTNVSAGLHELHHEEAGVTFLLLATGTCAERFYAYPAGMMLKQITEKCEVTAVQPGDGKDNDCDGRIDEETENYIDDDNDGLIDEDLKNASDRRHHKCQVIRDPHLINYEGHRTPLPIPCTYLLTTLTINDTSSLVNSSLPSYDTILVTVEAGNSMFPINGRFYVSYVNVSVTFYNKTVPGPSGMFITGTRIIQGGGNWTSHVVGDLQGRVRLGYNEDERMATLQIERASPKVQFRPAIREQGNHQNRTPGVFVKVGADLIYDSNMVFPNTLASTVNDSKPYTEYAREFGVDKHAVGVYAVILQNRQPIPLGCQDPVCMSVSDLYIHHCEDPETTFNRCEGILPDASTVNCIEKNITGIHVLDVFKLCSEFYCLGEVSACEHVKDYALKCPGIDRTLNMQCNELEIVPA